MSVDIFRIKYRWNFRFEKVVADKITAACVFIQGTRFNKSADGVIHFEDFASAKSFAEHRTRNEVERLEKELVKARYNLDQVLATTEENVPVSTSTSTY